jgi:hypothetical protein
MMFELIGIITFYCFIITILLFQYTLLISGVVRKDLNWFGKIVSWVPFIPFIIMSITLLLYFSSLLFRKMNDIK